MVGVYGQTYFAYTVLLYHVLHAQLGYISLHSSTWVQHLFLVASVATYYAGIHIGLSVALARQDLYPRERHSPHLKVGESGV
jgi:hypothetical protein